VSDYGLGPTDQPLEADRPAPAAFTPVGRRRLTQEERTSLSRRARLVEARIGLLVMAFPFLLFFALAIGTLMDEPSPWARQLGATGMLLLLVGCIVLALRARSWVIESRSVRRDARLGYVEQFRGVLSGPLASHPWMARLLAEGLLKGGSSEMQYLEVLPTSGYLWQANGARLDHWHSAWPAREVALAETPAFAAIAAEWVEPAVDDPSGLHVGERELTPDEIRELMQYIRRQRLRYARVALPLTVWLGAILGLCLQSGRLPTGYELLMLAGLGIATAAWDALLVSCLLKTRLLSHDARVGRVIIARFTEESEAERAESSTLSPPVEVLPVSGAEWTSSGLPAAWRITGER
jgi:hypothetical protein